MALRARIAWSPKLRTLKPPMPITLDLEEAIRRAATLKEGEELTMNFLQKEGVLSLTFVRLTNPQEGSRVATKRRITDG